MTTELDKLTGIAAAADGEATNQALADIGGEAEAVPEPISKLDEARGMVAMFVGLVCGFAPEAAEIWTPEAQERSAMAIVPVLEKYNISMTAIPCELVAAVVVVPLMYQTSKLVALRIQAVRDAKAQANAPAATRPPGQEPDKPEELTSPQMALYKSA